MTTAAPADGAEGGCRERAEDGAGRARKIAPANSTGVKAHCIVEQTRAFLVVILLASAEYRDETSYSHQQTRPS